MGAGAVKGEQQQETQPSGTEHQTTTTCSFTHTSNGCSPRGNQTRANSGRKQASSQPGSTDGPSMACENCSANFTLFKRKKTCCECGRHHCSACLVKEPNRPSTQRRCTKCRLLSHGNFTRHDLQKFEVRDLRSFLSRKGVNTVTCSEKNDLIELALDFSNSSQYLREQRESQEHTARLEQRRREQDAESRRNLNQHQQQQQPQQQQQQQHSPHPTPRAPPTDRVETEAERAARLQARREEEMRAAESRLHDELQTEEPDSRPRRQHASINQLKEEGDINDLTVRQLKEILATNYVDYKGCVEKWELIQRVKRLWEESQQNREKLLEAGDGADADESDLCKVCMDAVVDCVLLECGHMLTCTPCGRQLSECPICRQYIVRVVHTFRA